MINMPYLTPTLLWTLCSSIFRGSSLRVKQSSHALSISVDQRIFHLLTQIWKYTKNEESIGKQKYGNTEIQKYWITEIHMFSWSAACAPSLASSSSLCPFPLWWTGHFSTKPKIHHSSTIIKNDHQLWPIKTVSRALFSGCDSRGHEIELTWGKFHYLESWTKAKIGTLMVSRYLICAPNSRLFQITQNEFYSCMLPSNFIRKKLFAFLLNCRGKCRFI